MKGKAWLLLMIAVSGTLIFGGLYWLIFVVLGSPDTYSVQFVPYVEYAYSPQESRAFYTESDWNNWLHSDGVCVTLLDQIEATPSIKDLGIPLNASILSSYLDVQCEENYQMLTISVNTLDPSLSMTIAISLSELFPSLVQKISDIEVTHIRLVDFSSQAFKVIPDVRPVRAFLLGAVIFFLFTPIFFLLIETGRNHILIPDTFTQRYHIPAFSLRTAEEYLENLGYLQSAEPLAALEIGKNLPSDSVLSPLLPNIPRHNLADQIPEKSTVLLIVAADTENESDILSAIHSLEQRSCVIKAAILWQPDRVLLTDYYTLPFS
jgi:capsular polysaccharide biosynthesis protein